MASQPKIGFHVPLSTTEDSSSAISAFLKVGRDLTKEEPGTLQWFAVKFTTPSAQPEFLAFDTFPDEDARQAHLHGKCGAKFGEDIPPLLSAPLAPEPMVYLASKVVGGATVTCGLHVTIVAKPEKVDALKEFLVNALPLVEAETDTLVWYAVEFPDRAGTFAIIDAFPSEEGRQAHLNGKVAAALFGPGKELLSGEPEVKLFDVVAAKV